MQALSLWIKHPTLDGYRGALNNWRFHQYPGSHAEHLQLRHPQVICTVVSTCVAASWLWRFDFPGRKLMFNIMLATCFLPQVVPECAAVLCCLTSSAGWTAFYLAISWVHCAFATETYFVYQLVQFMRARPLDLDEPLPSTAAPPSRPCTRSSCPCLALLVSWCTVPVYVGCNDFMGPLLYVSTPGEYPMSLFVKLSMDGDTGFAWNKILALSLISILPQLIVFFCAQDQFVEGISAGAVKG